MGQLYTNNASTRLAIDIDDLDTSIVLDAGTGSLFPQPVGVDDFFKVSLENVAGLQEICKCISRAADTLIVERAQEGTAAIAFASQSRVECRLTAETMDNLMQADAPLVLADLNLNNFALVNGETVGVPVRGDSGVTTNEFRVPSGGGDPTIGGSKVWTAANDGPASGLDADTVDGLQASQLGMPTGTRMVFHQAAPPTGWTIDAGFDNHALRIVAATGGGSAGTDNFTTVFGVGKVTAGHALTTANLAAHSHFNGVASPGDAAFVYGGTASGMPGLAVVSIETNPAGTVRQGNTSPAGSGTAHTHGLTDMNLKYADVVIGVKD